jgi:DNA-binding NarL/FixJ family response regulator
MNNQEVESSPALSAPAITVWLVDDNKNVRTAVKSLLALCGGVRCEAEFHSPNAVLSALASRPGPDAILLDIQMGAANGLDAIRPIKALSRQTQVVMFTTCFDSESKQRALTNGASDFLLKSAPFEKIVTTLEHAAKHPTPHLKSTPASRAKTKVQPACGSSRSPRRLLWLDHCLGLLSVRKRSIPQVVR